MRGDVTQQGGKAVRDVWRNRSTCGKLHARRLFQLDAGRGGGGGHPTTRNPREFRDRTDTFDFQGENKRKRRRGEARQDEERRGMREMTKWKKCERAEQKWRG